MFIEEMEILIECKRFVEDLLCEKQSVAKYLEKVGRDTQSVEMEIERLQRVLSGKRPDRVVGFIKHLPKEGK
jgi:hypothetical protein